MIHDGTAAGTAEAVGDAAARDGERGSRLVIDGTAVFCLAAGDGDIVERQMAEVADAAAVGGPAAGERSVTEGQGIVVAEQFNDVTICISTVEVAAQQLVAVQVDGDVLGAAITDFQI